MPAELRLDKTGAPVVVVDVAGTPRRLTAWGVVDAGDAAALLLTTGEQLTAGQAAEIASQLDPDTLAQLRLARDGRLTAIEHATAWEAAARAARRPATQPIRPVEPATEPIRAAAPASEPARPRSGATALSVARGRVDWADLDQHDQRSGHDEDLVDEAPRRRWVDVLALILLAALGIAGIAAGVALDSLVVGIFGGCCAGAALGVAVAAP